MKKGFASIGLNLMKDTFYMLPENYQNPIVSNFKIRDKTKIIVKMLW